MLLLSPGRAENTALSSTPKPASCWAKPQCGAPSAEFVAFLTGIAVDSPATKEIHVIAANLSAD
jgi:hypothetical protein